MTRMLIAVTLSLVACGPDRTGNTACDEMCDALVYDCQYEAFPTIDSCVQGCTYNADQGADVEGQLTCVQGAACDTFAIVECEHEFGLEE